MTRHLSVDRAKRVDRSCRNHGSCPYCRRSRTRNQARREQAANDELLQAHQAFTRDGVVFNYYPRDGYLECAYCCHGWILEGDQAPANAANYCPNCGHKVKAVVVRYD